MVKLKTLRHKLALSQREMATKVGLTLATWNRLERGRHEARPTTRRKIAAALGMLPSDIHW